MGLIINRHAGETVIVGEGESRLVIRVLEMKGRMVRLVFEGPEQIRVVRGELADTWNDGLRKKQRTA